MKLSFGNILEWYDFSLYIYFATSIATAFFPSNNHFVGMLLALGTFFLGFVARPFGGLLMGWLGDRYGKKWVVNICVVLMGIATFSVALVPTYDQIGIVAPIILITLRILQGISVGGQFPGLLSLSVEDYKVNQGFAIGMVYSISSLGFLVASLVSFVVTILFSHLDQDIIWRIPFALSGILFLIYLVLNRSIIYSKDEQKRVKQKNVLVSLAKQWKAIISVVFLTTMAASLYFLVFTYFVNYQTEYLNVSAEHAYLSNTIALLLACLLYPLFGSIADRLGYLNLFSVTASLLLLLAFPLMLLIQTGQMLNILLALYIFTILMAGMQASISPLFASSFTKEWRTTGCAFSYSIGNGIAGAAPLIAEILAHYDAVYGISVFIILLLIIGSCGMWLIYTVRPKELMRVNTAKKELLESAA